jgi:hypothetical protein
MSAASERVLAALGPGALYAVLDGARDRGVRAVAQGQLARCLYRGPMPRALADAAPCQVRLLPRHECTERYFKLGWRQSWGIVLAHTGTASTLYRHLRRFLRVRADDGRILAFRYYDPRVLRIYLPTCTPGELQRLFGPISAIAIEADEPGFFHLFRRSAEGGFEQLRFDMGMTPPTLVRSWPQTLPEKPRHLLHRIRDRQLRALQERADEEYVAQTTKLLRRQYRRELGSYSDRALSDRCRDALARASRYGLVGDDVLSFVVMTFTLSPSFDAEPAFRSVFNDPSISGRRKLAALYERVPPERWAAARTVP